MTPADAILIIRTVRALRCGLPNSPIARHLEIELCRQLWLELTPDAPEIGPFLAVFRGKPREDLQTVCLGIIQGRPGDGAYPWRLQV